MLQSRILLSTLLLAAYAASSGCSGDRSGPAAASLPPSNEADFPAATAHSIVLEDGQEVRIPQDVGNLAISDDASARVQFRKWARANFTTAEAVMIESACSRETSRLVSENKKKGIPPGPEYSLKKPLYVLCQTAASSGSFKK